MTDQSDHDALAGAAPFAAMRLGKSPRVSFIPVPYAHHRILPKCASCGDRHPLAYQPPLDVEVCPSCGAAAAQPGPEIDVPAELGGGLAVRTAKGLVAVGQWFKRLAERM